LVEISKDFYRPAEVELLYGDSTPARIELKWTPEISFDNLVQRMVEYDLELEHAKR
jgi:GDPmannose 4,6-dehydratase